MLTTYLQYFSMFPVQVVNNVPDFVNWNAYIYTSTNVYTYALWFPYQGFHGVICTSMYVFTIHYHYHNYISQ